MANQLGKTYSELPTWAKGVIFVGGAVIVVALGLSVKNYIKRKRAEGKGKGALKDAGSTLRALAKAGILPKYNDMQYKSWGDKMFTLMDGYQTDEQGIYDIMKQMQNDADVLKLIEAYGVRTLSTGVGNPTPNTPMNLVSALNEELDNNEMFVLNGILAKKNIKYRF